jgi:hypothetical protein
LTKLLHGRWNATTCRPCPVGWTTTSGGATQAMWQGCTVPCSEAMMSDAATGCRGAWYQTLRWPQVTSDSMDNSCTAKCAEKGLRCNWQAINFTSTVGLARSVFEVTGVWSSCDPDPSWTSTIAIGYYGIDQETCGGCRKRCFYQNVVQPNSCDLKHMNLKRLCPCGDPSAEGRDMPVGESLLPNPTTTPKYTTPPPPCPAGKYSSVVNKARGCGGGSSPCPVSASSRYEDFAASLAVDGQTDNYFHTVCDSANEWFMLDLESESNIASVTIYNRANCGWMSIRECQERFQGAEIRVGNVNSFDGNPACASNLPGDAVITVTCGATGRYVFVVQPRSNTCLNFAEIEVFVMMGCISCAAGKYKAAAGVNTACGNKTLKNLRRNASRTHTYTHTRT